MSFQQGLSGLNTASQAINVTSNNIANSSTVGFKSSVSHFADVYANSLSGSGAGQVGIGVSLSAVQQSFTQGNITTTSNPLDISINGAGFFRMDQNGAVTYTRNGQFHLDKDGFVVNDAGLKLTGYAASSGIIVPSTPSPLQISASDLAPVATGANTSSTFQGVKANLNLDSRQTEPTTAWSDGPAAATVGGWSPDPLTYNYSTALSVYDSLGNAHTVTMYFRKAATAGDWEVYANADGTTNLNSGAAGPITTLNFDTSGQLASGSPVTFNIDLDNVATSLGKTSSATTPLTFPINFTGTTQFGSASGTNSLQQDGYTAGHLVGLSVGADGVIQGRYSNGQTFNQGQVVLANFTNPNGLQALGDNQWSETSTSGPALIGAPNTSSLGVLQAGSVEESNVDLTAQLVNLITQQRNYQANAQSIKTEDQIMQTLVNLR